MGADGQVRAPSRLVEIAAGGTGATALRRHGAVHRAKAFLLVAVEIVGTRIARLHPGFNHRLEERIIARLRCRHAHRAIAAVVVVRPDIAGFRFPVVGQAVEIAPVFQTRLFGPVIQIHRVTANVAHAVDQRGAAEPFAAPALHAAVVHVGFRFGLVGPVVAFALQRVSQRGGHLGAEIEPVVRAAGFQQQDGGVWIFSQSCCQNVAGGAGANNDVVKLQKNLPVKIWTGIYPSQPGWTSPGCSFAGSSRRFRGRCRSAYSRQPASPPGIHPSC